MHLDGAGGAAGARGVVELPVAELAELAQAPALHRARVEEGAVAVAVADQERTPLGSAADTGFDLDLD